MKTKIQKEINIKDENKNRNEYKRSKHKSDNDCDCITRICSLVPIFLNCINTYKLNQNISLHKGFQFDILTQQFSSQILYEKIKKTKN